MPKTDHSGKSPRPVKAFHISFRTYGTWLHGDKRGSMDRSDHHARGSPLIPPDPEREERERKLMKGPAVSLDKKEREIVETTIQEVCEYRGWHLLALNVQSQHVHLVVWADSKPEFVMNSLKSWATRRVRENGFMGERKVWSRHGSTVWLWTEQQVRKACEYVVELQQAPGRLAGPP